MKIFNYLQLIKYLLLNMINKKSRELWMQI